MNAKETRKTFFIILIASLTWRKLSYGCREMCHCTIAQCRASKRCLHRVAVRNAQHPHNNTTSAFFIALNFEFAILERKLCAIGGRRGV